MPEAQTGTTHYHAHCTDRTSRQRSYNERVDCLLCNKAMIYDLWDGSFDQCKVLWLGWLSCSSTATLHRYIQIQYNTIQVNSI